MTAKDALADAVLDVFFLIPISRKPTRRYET